MAHIPTRAAVITNMYKEMERVGTTSCISLVLDIGKHKIRQNSRDWRGSLQELAAIFICGISLYCMANRIMGLDRIHGEICAKLCFDAGVFIVIACRGISALYVRSLTRLMPHPNHPDIQNPDIQQAHQYAAA